MKRKDLPLSVVFGLPALLGLAGLIGLIGALIADGVWDIVGAGLLGLSIVAIAWARWKASRT